MNNSEALSRLKESAQQQSDELKNTVKEMHKESLKEIENRLTFLHEKSLSGINKDINKKLNEIQREIEEQINVEPPTPWAFLLIIGVLSILIGALAGSMVTYKLKSEPTPDQVKKMEKNFENRYRKWLIKNYFILEKKRYMKQKTDGENPVIYYMEKGK